jgi:hypothetical protein
MAILSFGSFRETISMIGKRQDINDDDRNSQAASVTKFLFLAGGATGHSVA